MKEERSEGIVLRSVPFKEKERILTLFTPHFGLISLIVKSLNTKSSHLLSLTTPFSQGEFIYKKGRSDLYQFQDGDLHFDHLALRNSLAHLQTAGAIAQAILSSQLPGKPSSALYTLFAAYLRQIPFFTCPHTLASSFYLKMLKHDGILTLQNICMHCAQPAAGIYKGESICPIHKGLGAVFFSSMEWPLLLELQNSRSMDSLKKLCVSSELAQTIRKYFTENCK
jgi:DNA repair protein RecO (recombination protein O)